MTNRKIRGAILMGNNLLMSVTVCVVSRLVDPLHPHLCWGRVCLWAWINISLLLYMGFVCACICASVSAFSSVQHGCIHCAACRPDYFCKCLHALVCVKCIFMHTWFIVSKVTVVLCCVPLHSGLFTYTTEWSLWLLNIFDAALMLFMLIFSRWVIV